jgi:hypothetical protein
MIRGLDCLFRFTIQILEPRTHHTLHFLCQSKFFLRVFYLHVFDNLGTNLVKRALSAPACADDAGYNRRWTRVNISGHLGYKTVQNRSRKMPLYGYITKLMHHQRAGRYS